MLRTAEYKKYYFQKDGVLPHTATTVQTWLSEKFGDKFIDKNSWPPRSPDFNLCEFFMGLSKVGHVQSIAKNIE